MLNIATIICNYNFNHYLKDAIQSCIDQTHKNFICVIDDCSKESPIDILTELFGPPSHKDKRLYFQDKAVLLINETNMGPSYSRNRGILECAGFDAYAILDADDFMLPTKIEKMAKVLEDKNIGVVYADYYILDEINGYTRMEFKHPYDVFMLHQNCIVHSGSMISANYLNAVKIRDGEWYNNELRVAEDYNLWLRLCKTCLFKHIPEFLTVARDHNLNSSKVVPAEVWQDNLIKATR